MLYYFAIYAAWVERIVKGKVCTAAGFAPAGFERDVESYLLEHLISQQEVDAEGAIEIRSKGAEILVLKK